MKECLYSLKELNILKIVGKLSKEMKINSIGMSILFRAVSKKYVDFVTYGNKSKIFDMDFLVYLSKYTYDIRYKIQLRLKTPSYSHNEGYYGGYGFCRL